MAVSVGQVDCLTVGASNEPLLHSGTVGAPLFSIVSDAMGESLQDSLERHLIKTCTETKETVPVIKKVCSYVREENPYGNGSSLVKKCKTSIGWKVITKKECEYEEHAWEH